MNAKEVRELAQKNLKGPVIAPFLRHVRTRIEQAAQKGLFSIDHPFSGANPYPSIDQQETVFAELQQDGFKVQHYPNPDPGHPCSSAYDSISWR